VDALLASEDPEEFDNLLASQLGRPKGDSGTSDSSSASDGDDGDGSTGDSDDHVNDRLDPADLGLDDSETQQAEAAADDEDIERVRTRGWSDVDRKAVSIRARNPELSLEEALHQAKQQLLHRQGDQRDAGPFNGDGEQGVSPEVSEGAHPQGATDASAAAGYLADSQTAAATSESMAGAGESSSSMQALQAAVEAAKAERNTAMAYFDAAGFAAAEERLEQAREALRHGQTAEQHQMVETQTRFYQQAEDSKSRAVELYPEAAREGTRLHARMTEMFTTFKATNNPLLYEADMPLRLVQMAANSLGIAPRARYGSNRDNRNNAGRHGSGSSSSDSRYVPGVAAPASGGARATTYGSGNVAQLLHKLNSAEAFDDFAASLGQRSAGPRR
jgi:hypothetical protein